MAAGKVGTCHTRKNPRSGQSQPPLLIRSKVVSSPPLSRDTAVVDECAAIAFRMFCRTLSNRIKEFVLNPAGYIAKGTAAPVPSEGMAHTSVADSTATP